MGLHESPPERRAFLFPEILSLPEARSDFWYPQMLGIVRFPLCWARLPSQSIDWALVEAR